MTRVLFVCTGNICRSPTAEGVFRAAVAEAGLAAAITADSAGTTSWHAGEAPDPRTIAAAAARDIDISALRARCIEVGDFHDFDMMLAMDRSHLGIIESMAPARAPAKTSLFLDFAPDAARSEVPDPYYGGEDGFEHVLDLVEIGARGLLEHIIRAHGGAGGGARGGK
jgi:protein-tyrosine phosphatase